MFPLRCCALCKQDMCQLVLHGQWDQTLVGITDQRQVVVPFKHEQIAACPWRVPLLMSRRVCRSRNRGTDEQTKEQTRCGGGGGGGWEGEAGLTRFERVIDRAGDSSLPSEQGATEAHVVSRVSDAELGHEQLPGWLLHQGSDGPALSFSRARRRRRRRWQPLESYLWPCILYFRVVLRNK